MNPETIELLKYGALGLCVILISLVAKLIYSEQKRPGDARPPIMKSITYLLISSTVLTIIFAYFEFSTDSKSDPRLQSSIDKIWDEYYSEHTSDSTLALKAERILKNDMPEGNGVMDTNSICSHFAFQLSDCEEELSHLDKDFYTNILLLRKEIEKAGGDFINVDWKVHEKQEVYSILKRVLTKLGRLSSENASEEEVRAVWKSTKREFSAKNPEYIVTWDLAQLVRLYIDEFFPVDEV